jgi:hypothetical protein
MYLSPCLSEVRKRKNRRVADVAKKLQKNSEKEAGVRAIAQK